MFLQCYGAYTQATLSTIQATVYTATQATLATLGYKLPHFFLMHILSYINIYDTLENQLQW